MCGLRVFVLPASRLLHAAPLFEEKRDFGSLALIPNIRDPSLQDWPRAWTRLALTFLDSLFSVV